MEKIESALTQTVQKGGCAAKVSATELRHILSQVHFPKPHPELLVDGRFFDDAGVYQINESIAMVQTLDFFTPILDSPRYFGAVAAANALSDVYAMGGRPKTAMGILAFPLASMSPETIVEVMQGASDIVDKACANFVGGHSIDDDTLKFGLSVTGFVHPEKIWKNTGAKIGDHLILTKPLGTGTITAALKRQEIKESDMLDVIASMSQINNVIDYMPDHLIKAIHAATDITGFGLSGHCMQLAKASQVTLNIEHQKLPLFPLAMEFLKKNFLTKAHRTNAEYTSNSIETENLSSLFKYLIHDPQTSGGLLLAVDSNSSAEMISLLKQQFQAAAIIGQVNGFNQKSVIFE